MKYKIRKLNLLDIRRMAKLLKELNISKESLKDVVTDIFTSANDLSKNNQNPESISNFIKAITPAIDGLIYLLADCDSFWDFLASLLGVEYEELGNIGIFEIKEIITDLIGDEQVISFFTSIFKAQKQTTTA